MKIRTSLPRLLATASVALLTSAALLVHFASQVFSFETAGARLNYGLEKVRFPSPVPVDSRLRSHVRFGEVRDLATGTQVVVEHTIEIDGHDKPACVAAHVVLLLG